MPRAAWANKPNLSQGDQFAIDYCDMPARAVYGPSGVHSASVTLLGEPIISAGVLGLVVSQAVLAITLTMLTLLLLRQAALGPAILAALLPWLVDFDQSLALYFANATKMFLYMSPAILMLVWLDRRVRPETPERA